MSVAARGSSAAPETASGCPVTATCPAMPWPTGTRAKDVHGGRDDHLQELGVRDARSDRTRGLRDAERLSEARGEANVVRIARDRGLHGGHENRPLRKQRGRSPAPPSRAAQ